MEYVYASVNQIVNISEEIRNCKNLKAIDLQNYQLGHLLQSILNLKKLKEMNLSNSQFYEWEQHWSAIPNLNHLYVSFNIILGYRPVLAISVL